MQTSDISQNPLFSVIVAIVSDTTSHLIDLSHLEGSLESLFGQEESFNIEVIVPYPSAVREVEQLKERFRDVIFLPVNDLKTYTGQGGSREHHDELRARGMLAAHGEIIALLEDHARAEQHWCRRVVEAHRSDFAAIGGAIENGIDRLINWAVYFCDFGKYQNPLPAGPSAYASDANISYKRSVLELIRPIWQQAFHEPEVNWALISRGEKVVLSPDIIVYQYRSELKIGNALKERFVWGRSYAANRNKNMGFLSRILHILFAPFLPFVLSIRLINNVLRKRRNVNPFFRALPLIFLLTICWAFGEFIGYITNHV